MLPVLSWLWFALRCHAYHPALAGVMLSSWSCDVMPVSRYGRAVLDNIARRQGAESGCHGGSCLACCSGHCRTCHAWLRQTAARCALGSARMQTTSSAESGSRAWRPSHTMCPGLRTIEPCCKIRSCGTAGAPCPPRSSVHATGWPERARNVLCSVPGVVADRPCCASLSEWSCRGFSESRARLHSSILQALLPDPRTRETSGITHPDAPPPLLVLTVGVPGTGKSAALRALADALLSPASLLPEGVRGERREAGRGTGNEGDASAGLHTGMGAGEGTLPTAQAIRRAAAAAGFVWGDGVSFDLPGASPAGNQGSHQHTDSAQQRGKCYVACDDVKLLLAQPDKDERSPQPGTTSSSECSRSAVGAGDGAGGGIPAPGSQQAAAGKAGVAAPVGEDALSARVRQVNLMANETRPLVHSQVISWSRRRWR